MTSAVRFAVDIGNSGIRVVLLPDDPRGDLPAPMRINWLGGVNSPHSEQRQFAAEDPEWPERLLRLLGRPTSSQWWISSVNRSATATLLGRLRQLPGCTIELVDYRRIPLWLEVDQPAQVGIDRLLAAWAASQSVAHRPLLVIQAGSAVTVDLVDAQSPHASPRRLPDRFLGGAILPGVPMVLRLLGQAADLLPELEARELVELPPLPGRNTEAAMLAGVASGLVGGVQHLVQRYRQQHAQSLPIVISGGDGPLLLPHLPPPVYEIPQLVLEGLRLLTTAATVPASES